MLKDHPEIFMPASKEPWLFAEELHWRTPPRPEGTPRTLPEYAEWFTAARPGQRVGDGTAYYLWSKTAAANIAKVNPAARIVAILREPASFLHSLHLQLLEVYTEVEPDLGRAMELEAERSEGRSVPHYTYFPQMLLYSEFVRYAAQLQRFYAETVEPLVAYDEQYDTDLVQTLESFLDADANVAGNTVIAWAVKNNPQLELSYLHSTGLVWAAALRKDSADLRKTIENAIECMKLDGTLGRLHEKWYGQAPQEGSAIQAVYFGYGAPTFKGFEPVAHVPKCG